MRVLPGQKVPNTAFKMLDGSSWASKSTKAENFNLIVFYRGLHCPICKKYLKKLDEALPEFSKRGIEVLAVSADPKDRAGKAVEDWELKRLSIAHDFPLDQAAAWGLYVSQSIKDVETRKFVEPGFFLSRPDGTLHWASIASMPFARPPIDEIIEAVDFIRENQYPPRGSLAPSDQK